MELSNNKIQQQLNKDLDEVESPFIKKHCHFIDGENAIIFIGHKLVRNLQIDKSTVFEQMLTNEGILLRKIS